MTDIEAKIAKHMELVRIFCATAHRHDSYNERHAAVEASARELAAQQSGEPVAEVGDLVIEVRERAVKAGYKNRDPLYAHPPARLQPKRVTPSNVGSHCMSEDECMAAGIDFAAYERGVADAAEAFGRDR